MPTTHHRDDTTFTVSDLARDTLIAMQDQCRAATEFWGRHEAEAVAKMNLSLAANLTRMLASTMNATTTIARDGDLSLYVVSGIHYGVIFHANYSDAPVEGDLKYAVGNATRLGRYCMAYGPDGESYCLKPFYKGEATCDHEDAVVIAAPVLGEWSFHS